MRALAGIAFALALGGPAHAVARLAPGVSLIPGTFDPGRQPDGNTLILEGRDGLIVFDTGRHAAMREQIEAFAAEAKRPVAAIVNSHWHLDHVSGNIGLKRAFPSAAVYASNAIDGALTGFLKRSAEGARAALNAGKLDATTAAEVRGDLATFDAGDKLRPDHIVSSSGTLKLAGRAVRLNLARDAATEGDVWLYDPASRIVLAGDLVTLPVPFMDTACPEGWRKALADVAATPFRTLVPGHGAPMSPAQFGVYRAAFGRLVDCAATDVAKERCADGWVADAGALVSPDQRSRAARMASYYVADVIRAGTSAKYCRHA